MAKMAKVTVIPSTIDPLSQLPIGSKEKLKVAAYARVSTNTDEQYTSYEAQVNYYKGLIRERLDWEYVDVYSDEGISGINTKRRVGFNKMINDALDGKINLIITKSISRFARNTLDTISYVRKLKEKGIEVYFEKENLWTLDQKSELILTIMASIAQEESRSISQNVTWGKRVAFQEGRVSFAYSTFLGYKKENDKIMIVEEEAEIVRRIYRMFLVEGKTATGIARYLKEHEVKTPSGKNTNWTKNTVTSILSNEKYKGDALLQKTFTDNFLEQTVVKNTGQIPQYYVENSHPAIIDRSFWDLVQIELQRRSVMGPRYSANDLFSSKLICEDCGGFYGRKKWHSGSNYEKFVYQCNNKFHKGKDKCLTPHLNQEDIKEKFIKAYNLTMADKRRIIDDANEVIELLTDTSKIDEEIVKINDEIIVVSELVSKLVKENSKTDIQIEEYNKRYEQLSERYEKLRLRHEELLKQKNSKQAKAIKLTAFISSLENSEDQIQYWNEMIWMLIVESATVHRDSSITFKFYNGLTVK